MKLLAAIDLADCDDNEPVLSALAVALEFPDWFGHNRARALKRQRAPQRAAIGRGAGSRYVARRFARPRPSRHSRAEPTTTIARVVTPVATAQRSKLPGEVHVIRRSSPLVSNLRLMAISLASAAVIASVPVRADTLVCGSLAGWGGSSPGTPDGFLRPGVTCFSRVEPANGGLIIAEADADRGIVRAASTVILPVGVSHVAQSSASWEEALWIIDHPDPLKQGTAGQLRYSFFIEGTLDGTGAASANMTLTVEGNRTPQQALLSIGSNSTTGPRVVSTLVEGTIGFIFGAPANFLFRMTTTAQRRFGVAGAGFAEAIFTNSGYWGGITAVEDADGILEGFTFGGPDLNFGATFTTSTIPAPVPLPASVWLLVTGVAGLLWRRRARSPAR